MKALHVFPIFGDDLTNGSEYVEFMLTRKLVDLGVEVEVFATCSRQVRQRWAFGLDWLTDYPRGSARVDDIPVRRFPVSYSLPPVIGRALSHVVVRRWQKEEARGGRPSRQPNLLIDSYHRRALSRPLVYDYLTLFGRGPISLRLIAAAIRESRHYDLILVGFMPFATIWYMTAIARWSRKPIVLLPLFHPEDIYHHFQVFYRCFERADALLAQTRYSTALFRRLFPAANPVQAGVGVDAEALSSEDISGARFRAKHDLGNKPVVLFVGRKEHHKRYDLAVQAVDSLEDPNVTLVMIGHDVDRLPTTSPRVRFLGPVERRELLDAYDACNVFVLPSEHESFGIVFLEAWMRRKPVIGNGNCAPVASVIEDGRDGFLCDGAADIAAKTSWLLANPSQSARMGEAGRAKVVARYTWDAVARKVLSLYEALVPTDRCAPGQLELDRKN